MAFALSSMGVSSPAFTPGGAIPQKHTGEGQDVSPALEWNNAPSGTRAFAVVCHDPDAPLVSPGSYGYVHWVLYNIPLSVGHLDEGTSEFTNGQTDNGKPGWGGPMPPKGHGAHHYFFWVFALDSADLNLPPGLTLWQLMSRIEPHTLGMSRLMGTYERT